MIKELPMDFDNHTIRLNKIKDWPLVPGLLWKLIESYKADGMFWNLEGSEAMSEPALRSMEVAVRRARHRAGYNSEYVKFFLTKREGFTFVWLKDTDARSVLQKRTQELLNKLYYKRNR